MLLEFYFDYNYFDFDCFKHFSDFKLFLNDLVCRIIRDCFLDSKLKNSNLVHLRSDSQYSSRYKSEVKMRQKESISRLQTTASWSNSWMSHANDKFTIFSKLITVFLNSSRFIVQICDQEKFFENFDDRVLRVNFDVIDEFLKMWSNRKDLISTEIRSENLWLVLTKSCNW
jgi:hypothetical protein